MANEPKRAVDVLLSRQVMPTELGTAGLRGLDASLLHQSFFSARTMLDDLLGMQKDRIANILNPGLAVPGGRGTDYNPAYAREDLKRLLQETGYRAEPGEQGTIKDLSSNARIDLVLKTNVEMAQGEAWWADGQNEAVLDQWPGQELFRAESRMVPRDWLERWRRAGESTGAPIGDGWTVAPGGRLIALKNHPIWDAIGSSDLFDDGLDQPWPPFAFNSGMWVKDVDRTECEALGLIKPGEQVASKTLEEALA